MFKTGSKLLYALSGVMFLMAVGYAGATSHHKNGVMETVLGPLTLGYKGRVGDHTGFALFVGAGVVALFLAVVLSALRDADPEAAAQVIGLETVPDVDAPAAPNPWPVVAAFSAGAVALGLAIGSAMFVLGMVGLAIATVEWAVRAWSDRATGDPEVNRTIRNRFMQPVEVPAIAVLTILVLVLAVSRILLALPKNGGYAVFGLVPAVILGVGALIISKPKLSSSLVAGLLLLGGVAVLAGGIAASIAGEREVEHKESGHEKDKGEEGLAPLPAPAHTVIRVGA
jgi:hypothetical protein